jgi:1-acyl-sn-glycerol-3-phosphate acyltransferase
VAESVLGNQVPVRGNVLTVAFGRAVLRLLGWRLQVEVPNVPKAVVILAPHTSGWDFVIGMAAALALGLHAHWLGKHTLFRWPFGGFFRWLGGMAVDRSAAHGVVLEIDAAFRRSGRLFLALAPEGTRRRAAWKTGFYHIARSAGVPIIPAFLDYGHRVVGTFPPLEPGTDMAADLARLRVLYAGVQARYPERFANL